MPPLNDQHRVDIAQVCTQVWELYADLKSHKLAPAEGYTSLNLLLLRLHKNKSELLLVLDRPEIPLHTDGSEGDIRGHVLKPKAAVEQAATSAANAPTRSPA